MENQWPKGYKAPVDLAKMGRNLKPFILQELRDQEADRARFSKLKDRLSGNDAETDGLLQELDHLQLEIIAELSRGLMDG
jgi:hypothetical protein